MAAKSLILEILTPLGSAIPKLEGESKPRTEVEVAGVEAPAMEGEIGVLPEHTPFISPLVPGVVRFRDGATDRRIVVGTGFIEIKEEGKVVVLTDRAMDSSEVDVAEATAALKEVNAKLSKSTGAVDATEHSLLTSEQRWLEAQLRAAHRS